MGFKDYFKEFQCLEAENGYILRQVNVDKDLKAYMEIYTDKDVFKYYGGGNAVKDEDTVKKILANQINEFEKAKIYSWTITEAETDFAIGRILLSSFESSNRIANIGYFINRQYWGKGIVSACINPVVNFGFDYLKLQRIYTKVALENTASWKALEKNGFTREGLLRSCFELSDRLHDCYMYSKLNTDK